MADISGGETWVEGQQVTGGRLNNHVNGAVIQPAFVTTKTSVTPAGADSLLLYDASGAVLARTTVTNLLALGGLGTVTSVGIDLPADTFTVGPNVTSSGDLTGAYKTQNAGEVHIAPAAAGGVPTWRRLDARDMYTNLVNIAVQNIDWNLGNIFYKLIAGHMIPTFSNELPGRLINVLIGNTASFTVNWASAGNLLWPGGTAPVQSTGSGHWDWYQFTPYASFIFANRIATNMQV